ncbi:hypothetical protein B0182_08040 [Moraxella bovis]|nr:hypothetical protein B0182_08040 [Moraxella bovis]
MDYYQISKHLTRPKMNTKEIQNDNLTFQSSVSNKGLGDELFELFANFDDDFICAIKDRDNEPPQEREKLDCIDDKSCGLNDLA